VPASEAAERRADCLDRLAGESVDLLVIGAGIIGSRVAYEAASRGLRVVLVDAGDFGGGTSAASSKLLHGGLRYLATGDFRLVRDMQVERNALATRIAPHLVRPLPLLLLVERDHARRVPKLAAALAVYSLVSGFSRPLPRLLRPTRAPGLVPVDPGGIRACGLIREACTHDARLTLATVRAAARAGAVPLNYVRAAALERAHGRIAAAVLEDVHTGAQLTLRSGAVVSATGPWLDSVRRLEDPRAQPLTRLSKGVHAFLPLEDDWHAGVALFDDSRSALAIPWQGMLMLGATDTPFEGDPADAAPDSADVETLLTSFSGLLSHDQLRRDRVVHTVAGLRVLPPGNRETAQAPRRHMIAIGPGGMISIAGGKLTTHRAIALEALRRLPAGLRPRRLSPSDEALPAARGRETTAVALRHRVDSEIAAHLLHLYGADAIQLLAYADSGPHALDRIHPDGPDVWAQAFLAVDEEWALTVEDITSRRTTLALRGLAGEGVRRALGALVPYRTEFPRRHGSCGEPPSFRNDPGFSLSGSNFA
jgi:glycerol-3-phosphate dehydrogenase